MEQRAIEIASAVISRRIGIAKGEPTYVTRSRHERASAKLLVRSKCHVMSHIAPAPLGPFTNYGEAPADGPILRSRADFRRIAISFAVGGAQSRCRDARAMNRSTPVGVLRISSL